MKKILLGAAFASMAMGAVAAGIEMPANLIKNGFFEEQLDEIVRGYEGDGDCILDTKDDVPTIGVPQWSMIWNPWCVRIDIRENEADFEKVFEGNNNLLHIFRFMITAGLTAV